jgi:Zn-dependent protease
VIEILITLLAIVTLIISIIIHELAHGFVSYSLGDPTPKEAGRLTLNPIKHIDPLGSIFLPLLLVISNIGIIFGWAKPVPIDPRNYKNIRTGWIITAMAGPISNFTLFVLMFLILYLFNLGEVAKLIIWYAMAINFVLGAFNLIPLPPLDGFWLIFNILPDSIRNKILIILESSYGIIINIVGALSAILIARYTVLPIVMYLQGLL